MNLFENPFYLLDCSPRDDRRSIVRAEEERSLTGDPSRCARARLDLTNPRNRVTAEVAWLPGVAPARAKELLTSVERDPGRVPELIGVPLLARANLMAAAMERGLTHTPYGEAQPWILNLAALFEELDVGQVARAINEDRAVAGFPEADPETVEEALSERRAYYRGVLRSFVDRLPSAQVMEVIRECVASTLADNAELPRLVEDLAGAYELEALRLLEREEKNVDALIDALKRAADAELDSAVCDRAFIRLSEVVRNWTVAARPMQLVTHSRGLDHDASLAMARKLRYLAIGFVREHDAIDMATRITELLRACFSEVPRIAEFIQRDEVELAQIGMSQRVEAQRSKRRETDWARAIELNITTPHPLRISTEGVEWNGSRWPLETISRIRWGGVRFMNYGTPKISFSVSFGNQTGLETMKTELEVIFGVFTQKLWLAVGSRLLMELIAQVAAGQVVVFGNVRVQDDGVWLPARRDNQTTSAFCRWGSVEVSSANGMLFLNQRPNARSFSYQEWPGASLSFIDVDNVHVLEAAISLMKEKGDSLRLSSVLRGLVPSD